MTSPPVPPRRFAALRLETFSTMKDACVYTGVSPSRMTRVCQNRSGTVGMYICRYASDVEGIDHLPPDMIYKPREMRHCWVKVACYDLNGNYICSYDSVGKAADAIGGALPSCISSCLTGGQHQAYGYMWRYDNGDAPSTIPPLSEQKKSPRAVPICQYDRFTGEKIATFSSITDAANHVGCSINAIKFCLSGKWKTAVNYIWRYDKDQLDKVDPVIVRGGRYDRDIGEAAN